MKNIKMIGSGGSGGFKVGPDQSITMADIEKHEQNLKIAGANKDIKR